MFLIELNWITQAENEVGIWGNSEYYMDAQQ